MIYFARHRFANGLPFHAISYDGAVNRIIRISQESKNMTSCVFTPNVHHYWVYDQMAAFREAYEAADLSLLDGMPLVWVARFLLGIDTDKVSGSDIFIDVFRRSVSEGKRIFLLGAAPGVAEKAVERLGAASVLGTQVFCLSPPIGFDDDESKDKTVVKNVTEIQPHILFVALGAPRQELWLYRHRHELGAQVGLAVGGSFDFAAGMIPRAPVWMQKSSLEWFFRLNQDPGRLWKRYLQTNTYFIAQMAWSLLRKTIF